MAAGTSYGTLLSSSGVPVAGYPIQAGSGSVTIVESYELATTNIDDIGDIVYLVPVPHGCKLEGCMFHADDVDTNATPTLKLAFLVSEDGTATQIGDDSPVVGANGASGTTFAAGGTGGALRKVNAPEAGYALIGVRAEAAAATAATGTLTLWVTYR